MLILKPLEEATRKLSVEKSVTSSKSDTIVECNLHELRKIVLDVDETKVPEIQDNSSNTSEECWQVLSGLIHSIELRYMDYEHDEIYSISTLLDPRFKEVPFSTVHRHGPWKVVDP